MVSTTAGGRPLKSAASHPGATHGGSTDMGAKELALFSVDPKPPLAEMPKHQVPVIAQLLSGLGQDRPIVEVVGDPGAHFP